VIRRPLEAFRGAGYVGYKRIDDAAAD